MNLGSDWSKIKSYLYYFLVMCSWTSYLTSWRLHFPIYKMDIISPIIQNCCEELNEIMCVSGLSQLHIKEYLNKNAFSTETLTFLHIVWILIVAVHDWQGGPTTSRISQFASLICWIMFSCGLYPWDYLVIIGWLQRLQSSHLRFRQEEGRTKEACLPANCLKHFPRCPKSSL